MKLITLIENWLDEFPIHQQASTLGLSYAGYGRWKDNATGKIVAKTINGKLKLISGVGNNSPISPSDEPNTFTASPIAGDGIDGNGHNISSQNDHAMEDEPKHFQNPLRLM